MGYLQKFSHKYHISKSDHTTNNLHTSFSSTPSLYLSTLHVQHVSILSNTNIFSKIASFLQTYHKFRALNKSFPGLLKKPLYGYFSTGVLTTFNPSPPQQPSTNSTKSSSKKH